MEGFHFQQLPRQDPHCNLRVFPRQEQLFVEYWEPETKKLKIVLKATQILRYLTTMVEEAASLQHCSSLQCFEVWLRHRQQPEQI